HEEVAETGHVLRLPWELVRPDAIAGDVGRIALFEHFLQGMEVRVVQALVVERIRALLDELVVVDVFPDVEKQLAVLVVSRQELTGNCLDDLDNDRFKGRTDERRIELGNPFWNEAKIVTKLVYGESDRHVDVFGGEPVYRETIDDAQRDRDVLLLRQGCFELRAQYLCSIEHERDLRYRPVRRIAVELRPVAVVANETGSVMGHIRFEESRHRMRESAQHATLLDERHPFESPQVR